MKTAKKWIALLLVLTMTMGLFAGLTVTAAAEDAAAVPTLKEGVAAVKTDTVKTGMAYLLSDLQAGRIFQAPEGTTISVAGKNYWWERSADGGATWSAREVFDAGLFGMTTIQVTEVTEGDYEYRFYATVDGGQSFSEPWTLKLAVRDNPVNGYTFYVGRDYLYNADTHPQYPVIHIYPSLGTDESGHAVPDYDNEAAMLYGNFTDTPDEGQEAYDVTLGTLESNYNMFYANLAAGDYVYEAFAYNTDTEEYDIPLGGMQLKLPLDENVDGGTGGGTKVYLQCNSFYASSKKVDNTYFGEDEYTLRLDSPIMGCTAQNGAAYQKGNYVYYPVVLYAGGNACLYNFYLYPTDTDRYIFTQNINQTFQPSYSAGTKSGKINTAVELTVTVPADAEFGLYFQWNNFNTTEVESMDGWTVNGGTKTAVYKISKGNGNYTWRMSGESYVTRTGWLSSANGNAALTLTWDGLKTDRLSHDFSQLGTQTEKRDEGDIQVNLDPRSYLVYDGTKRVRAYRHWQLINSDAGNIMVEPDFHWTALTGDADIVTVNGGNTTANWADITPGTQDSVITVRYDAVEAGTMGSSGYTYGSHGGYFPATTPQRVGVIVVPGTATAAGMLDADVDYNMADGAATTRSADWDYNYDTWYYNADEEAPVLTFALKGTGSVEYAFVTTTNDMVSTLSGYTALTAENGRYTVPLAALKTLGNGKGGTVILRMTDNAGGVSYRLVRAAEVTVKAENVTFPGETIFQPGDEVSLTFSGMFRAVNKISGVFNPTNFKPTYYVDGTKVEGTLGQYQKMDNSTLKLTIPENVSFADGEDVAYVTATNGFTFGSMYSAANPFAFLYNMTDSGVGTNFNAVIVNYYMHHYADVRIPVHRPIEFTVTVALCDENGAALDASLELRDASGKLVTPNADGTYTLYFGTYSYLSSKDGYARAVGSFKLGSADQTETNALTKQVTLKKLGDTDWNGGDGTEPASIDGIYQIKTGAELKWFADAVNAGQTTINAALCNDIDLSGFDWAPIGSSTNKFTGSFDGQNHTISGLYISAAEDRVGLFGYLGAKASIRRLGVTGNVTANGRKWVGGIVGYAENDAVIDRCWNGANVTGQEKVAGIIGGVQSFKVIVSNCYNVGTITATKATSAYPAGIGSIGTSTTFAPTIRSSYNAGTIKGASGAAVGWGSDVTNSYYLNTCGAAGKGTAMTAEQMKAADFPAKLSAYFHMDEEGRNNGFPVLGERVLTYVTKSDATCTEDGYDKDAWFCAAENKYYSDEAGTVELEVVHTPALGHEMTHHDAVTATCTEGGNAEYWTCGRACCTGKYFLDSEGKTAQDTIPATAALGHEMTHHDAVAATCTEGGNAEYWTCCNTCCEGKYFLDAAGAASQDTVPTTDATGHNMTHHDAVAATCTEGGNAEYWTCGNACCEGKYFLDSEGKTSQDTLPATAALGHEMTYHEAVPATCDETGVAEYWTCGRVCCEGKYFLDSAGRTAQDTLPVTDATGHELTRHEAKAATCTEAGNAEYWTCSHAGCAGVYYLDSAAKTSQSTVPTTAALGHSMTHHDAVAATCTEGGNAEYWTCGNACCAGKYFLDSEGKTSQDTLPTTAALGHNMTHHDAVAATCTEGGNAEYWTCGNACCAGKYFLDSEGRTSQETVPTTDATGHNMTHHDAVAATCTEDGTQEYWTCGNACCKGNYYLDEAGSKVQYAVPKAKALGHDYDADGKCSRCDAVSKSVTLEYASVQQDNEIILICENAAVLGSLSDRYGYSDKIAADEGVSALDVLIYLHEQAFGSDFTKETAQSYLKVSSSGWMTLAFGEDASSTGFTINSLVPLSDQKYGLSYIGYMINEAPVADGDRFSFFPYRDEYYDDQAVWFEQNGAIITSISGYAGAEVELTARRYGLMSGGFMYRTLEELAQSAFANPLASAELYWIDAETHETVGTAVATKDDGTAVIRLPGDSGSYYLSARVTAENVSAVAHPLLPVTVTPQPVKPVETPVTVVTKPAASLPQQTVERKGYADVPADAWYADAVQYVTDQGVMGAAANSASGSLFAPDKQLTRAMLWTILARMDGVDTSGGSTWMEKGRAWTMAKGISDGTNPNGAVTREQLAAMLWRFAGEPSTNGSLDRFSDAAQVSAYARTAMTWAVEQGIVTGSNGGLNPKGTATRAQVAAMLMRYLER